MLSKQYSYFTILSSRRRIPHNSGKVLPAPWKSVFESISVFKRIVKERQNTPHQTLVEE